MAFAAFVTMSGVLIAATGNDVTPNARALGEESVLLVQSRPSSPVYRSPSGPPTPAPRSWNSDTVTLPRVPYDNRIDSQRRTYRDGTPTGQPLRGPESQRLVPAPPGAGGNPAFFFDKPADQRASCEWLRRLVVRTGRLYWVTRYERCVGGG